jgi:hypothetical protein
MRTVEQEWASFESAVLSKNAGAIQRQEMRRAFYAGFGAALGSLQQMASESGDDDDLGVTMVESLHQECMQFVADIKAGRA